MDITRNEMIENIRFALGDFDPLARNFFVFAKCKELKDNDWAIETIYRHLMNRALKTAQMEAENAKKRLVESESRLNTISSYVGWTTKEE